ncbi:MAG: hypothetical protein IKO00_05740 [Oscillospiraceae bacterium]|nr:hypothetical protein [Oscillospiraceae bacterium]
MKKVIVIGIIFVVLVTIISVALATCINWNPDLYTGYVYTRGDKWMDALASGYEWEYRGIEYKITYSEIVRMAENGHRISWHYIGGRQAIGITYTDGIALVIFTDEERLLTGLGHYYFTF